MHNTEKWVLSWSWLYDSWIYNYMCNQCLSPQKLWIWTLFMTRCTRYNITPVSSTNKTDHNYITEILVSESGVKHHKPNHRKVVKDCKDTDIIIEKTKNRGVFAWGNPCSLLYNLTLFQTLVLLFTHIQNMLSWQHFCIQEQNLE